MHNFMYSETLSVDLIGGFNRLYLVAKSSEKEMSTVEFSFFSQYFDVSPNIIWEFYYRYLQLQ